MRKLAIAVFGEPGQPHIAGQFFFAITVAEGKIQVEFPPRFAGRTNGPPHRPGRHVGACSSAAVDVDRIDSVGNDDFGFLSYGRRTFGHCAFQQKQRGLHHQCRRVER